MNVTLYRYQMLGARWDESITEEQISVAQSAMTALALQGEEKHKYGVTFCSVENDGTMLGIFVQEFPKKLTHYEADTKEGSIVDEVDSDEFIFVIFPRSYTIYFQAKKSRDLPPRSELLRRFVTVCMLSNRENRLFFTDLEAAEDEVNRERIVDIFYNQADTVTEIEFEDFDVSQIERLYHERGRLQTYFNPIEEFQPAAQEAAIRFARHADKASLKAKQGESFKKDPVARIMVEGATRLPKITYTKDEETITESGVTRTKETVSVSNDFTDERSSEEISRIIRTLQSGRIVREPRISPDNDSQATLLLDDD